MLGWGVTIGASFASHPIDTIRRRMVKNPYSFIYYCNIQLFFVISIVDDDFWKSCQIQIFYGLCS